MIHILKAYIRIVIFGLWIRIWIVIFQVKIQIHNPDSSSFLVLKLLAFIFKDCLLLESE